MNKERKLLLWGLILGILVTVLTSFLSNAFDSVLSNNQQLLNSKVFEIIDIASYVLYGIGIIYFLIIIIFKKINLNNHAGGILLWSIIFLLLNVVTGIFGIMVYGKLEKEKKRPLPEIEIKKFTNKYICLAAFIICMLIMFVFSKKIDSFLEMVLMYVTMFILMISVFFKQLKHDFKIFREYFKEYMSLSIKTWLKSLVVMMILGIILQLTTNLKTSNNQATLQSMFNSYPVFVALLSVIYAPIVEELLFRGVLRKFFNSKYLFIVISGVAFGLLHVIDDSKTLAEFSYVFVYSTLGIFLSSLYYKTNNLFSNISFHFFQNTLGLIGMLLLYFIK